MLITREEIENLLAVLNKFLEIKDLTSNEKLKQKVILFRDNLQLIYDESDHFSVFDDFNSDLEELARIVFSPELSQVDELLKDKLNNTHELNLSAIKKKFFSEKTQQDPLLEEKLNMVLWDISESDLRALKYSTFSFISLIRQVERKQLDLDKISIKALERLHQESSETKSALYQTLLDNRINDHFNLTETISHLKLVGRLTKTNLWKSGKLNKPAIIRDTLASKELIQTLTLLKKHHVFKSSILGKIYRASDEKRDVMIQAINTLNIPMLNEKKDLKNIINTIISGKNPIDLSIIAKSKEPIFQKTAIEITKDLFKALSKCLNPIKSFLTYISLITNQRFEEKTKEVISILLNDQPSNVKNDPFIRTKGSGFYQSFNDDFEKSVDAAVKISTNFGSGRNRGHG
jgi:hypothetical protein